MLFVYIKTTRTSDVYWLFLSNDLRNTDNNCNAVSLSFGLQAFNRSIRSLSRTDKEELSSVKTSSGVM